MLTDISPSAALSDSQTLALRAHLDTLLRDEAFVTSRRSQEFLRYVVEEVLAGRGAEIKERNIAVEVFGKGLNFNSQAQSIVRVKAVEVRRRLAQAYLRVPAATVSIELPVGTYQPLVYFREAPQQVLALAPVQPPPSSHLRPGRLSVLFIALAGAAAVIAMWLSPHPQHHSFDQLWEPFVKPAHPVLISLPAPNVYTLRSGTDAKLPSGPGAVLPISDIRLNESSYVGVGAAAGAARFGEQLALRHHAFTIKFGSDVSFADLRQGPAILLGALTSHLTLEMTRPLPLRFDEEHSGTILDAVNSANLWVEEPASLHRSRVGYALVSRLLNSDSGNVILIVAGVNAFDTQSAVDFLTHEEFFDQFADRNADWQHKNFEILLRTSIHDHTPGRSKVVTARLW